MLEEYAFVHVTNSY